MIRRKIYHILASGVLFLGVYACTDGASSKNKDKGQAEQTADQTEQTGETGQSGTQNGGMPAELNDQAATYTGVNDTDTVAVTAPENGALAGSAPIDELAVYVVGMHPMHEHPDMQMAVHHYCTAKTENFAQCILFDGNNAGANMVGIEYILSEEAFKILPPEEKKLWHPHNFEILSGQLVAPGTSAEQDLELMGKLMNSYGKTWHTWNSKPFEGEGMAMPLGEPMLGWSFNREGQAAEGLVEQTAEKLDVDVEALKESRAELADQAHPQCGVTLMDGDFEGSNQDLAGIIPLSDEECYASKGTGTEEGGAEEGKPSKEEGQDTSDEGQGTVEEGQAVVEEGKPAVEEGKPAVEEGKPAVEEGKPVTEEGQGTVEEGTTEEGQGSAEEEGKPAEEEGSVEEGKPVVDEGKPAVEEGKPAVEEGKPVVDEGKPAVEEGKPVIEDDTPATEQDGSAAGEEGQASGEEGQQLSQNDHEME
jgi:hypothetical protein